MSRERRGEGTEELAMEPGREVIPVYSEPIDVVGSFSVPACRAATHYTIFRFPAEGFRAPPGFFRIGAVADEILCAVAGDVAQVLTGVVASPLGTPR